MINKGFFVMNNKHGFGSNFFKHKNCVIIGNWVDNNLEGIAIWLKGNNEEKILVFDKNKKKREIVDNNELSNIKISKQYYDLKEFYHNVNMLIPNPS